MIKLIGVFIVMLVTAFPAMAIEDYFSECRGNVNYEKLVSCAESKGIKIANGGYGVADSENMTALDAVAPTVLGCINMFLSFSKSDIEKRGTKTLVMKKYYKHYHESGFSFYDSSITIPVKVQTIYMEDIKDGYYGNYPVSTLDVKECSLFLIENMVLTK